MEEQIVITYCYTFANGLKKAIPLTLDATHLLLVSRNGRSEPPGWTDLLYHRCDNCTLDYTSSPRCPIALNLAAIVGEFSDFFAYESVHVEVTTAERTFMKDTTIQEGLSGLLGIIMTTSGCPVMEPLKPMVRFHLPFATLHETFYRMVSTWLMAQFFRSRRGAVPDLSIAGIEGIYADVAEVNRCMANRLLNQADKDANINAVVNLDFFTAMAPMAIEDVLEQLEPHFAWYEEGT